MEGSQLSLCHGLDPKWVGGLSGCGLKCPKKMLHKSLNWTYIEMEIGVFFSGPDDEEALTKHVAFFSLSKGCKWAHDKKLKIGSILRITSMPTLYCSSGKAHI